MTVQISEIKNAKLQEIAKQVDNGDGILKKKEYSLFAQAASKQGFDSKAIHDALDMKEGGIKAWWHDVDKISTDGKDDGKISFLEKYDSFCAGLTGGIVKNVVKHPVESIVSMAGFVGGSLAVGAAVSALTAGAVAVAPVAAAVGLIAGLGFGISAIVKGVKQTNNAKTDGDAKSGMENAGTGTAITLLSGIGFKNFIKNQKVKTSKVPQETKLAEEVKPTENADAAVEIKPMEEVKLSEEVTQTGKNNITESVEPINVVKADGRVQFQTKVLEKAYSLRNDYWTKGVFEMLQEHPEIIDKMYSFNGENGPIFNSRTAIGFLQRLMSKDANHIMSVLEKPEMQQLLLTEKDPMSAVSKYKDLHSKAKSLPRSVETMRDVKPTESAPAKIVNIVSEELASQRRSAVIEYAKKCHKEHSYNTDDWKSLLLEEDPVLIDDFNRIIDSKGNSVSESECYGFIDALGLNHLIRTWERLNPAIVRKYLKDPKMEQLLLTNDKAWKAVDEYFK